MSAVLLFENALVLQMTDTTHTTFYMKGFQVDLLC